MNSFILVNKPSGPSSAKVVNKFKNRFDFKIGHTGTLDPAACGLLVLATNDATKFIRFIGTNSRKYRFKMHFGIKTDTADTTGTIIEENNLRPTQEEVEKIIPEFIGKIVQVPPIFSAIKVDGNRAYQLARRGKDFELEPRDIQISSLKLTHDSNIQLRPKQEADYGLAPLSAKKLELKKEMKKCELAEYSFIVECSQGTYIRSLGESIAKRLGKIGCLSLIERLEHDGFSLEQITDGEYKIVDLEILLDRYPKLILNQGILQKMRNGLYEEMQIDDGFYASLYEGKFAGMIEARGGVLFCARMVKE